MAELRYKNGENNPEQLFLLGEESLFIRSGLQEQVIQLADIASVRLQPPLGGLGYRCELGLADGSKLLMGSKSQPPEWSYPQQETQYLRMLKLLHHRLKLKGSSPKCWLGVAGELFYLLTGLLILLSLGIILLIGKPGPYILLYMLLTGVGHWFYWRRLWPQRPRAYKISEIPPICMPAETR